MATSFKLGEERRITVRDNWTDYKWIGEKRGSRITKCTPYPTPKHYVVSCCRDLTFEENGNQHFKIWDRIEDRHNTRPLRSVLPRWVVQRLTDQIDLDIWLSQIDKISSDRNWYSAPDFVTPDEPQEEHVDKIRSYLKWYADRSDDPSRKIRQKSISKIRNEYSWGNYVRICLKHLIENGEVEKGEGGYYYTGE